MESQIMVSIVCPVYNHEKYLESCFEGFVNQKTNFKFEIIVHDDCSTDNSVAIIKRYKEKYPELFNVILQDTNKMSQGISIGETFINPHIKGKYVIICEGDDYWIDNNKLQKQVDWLENNKEYSACVHAANEINCETGNVRKIGKYDYDCDILIEDIIKERGAWQTATWLFKREYYLIPEYLKCGVGDYPRAINIVLSGKIRYMNEIMSVYRFRSNQYCWSSQNKNSLNVIKRYKMINNMLEILNENTNFNYNEAIQVRLADNNFRILGEERRYKEQIKRYPNIYKNLKLKDKLKLFIKAYFNGIYKLYKKDWRNNE